MPLEPDRQHTYHNHHNTAEQGTKFSRGKEKVAAHHIYYATGYACHGINLLTEDEGDFIDKDVADDTTRSTRDTPHDDSRPPGEAQLERLLNADDIEKGQADGVEDKPGILLTDKQPSKDDNPEKGDDATNDVNLVGKPEGSNAQHEVTDGPTTHGCSHAHDEGSKPVKTLGRRQTYARYSKRHSADKFYDDKRCRNAQRCPKLLHDVKHVPVLSRTTP